MVSRGQPIPTHEFAPAVFVEFEREDRLFKRLRSRMFSRTTEPVPEKSPAA